MTWKKWGKWKERLGEENTIPNEWPRNPRRWRKTWWWLVFSNTFVLFHEFVPVWKWVWGVLTRSFAKLKPSSTTFSNETPLRVKFVRLLEHIPCHALQFQNFWIRKTNNTFSGRAWENDTEVLMRKTRFRGYRSSRERERERKRLLRHWEWRRKSMTKKRTRKRKWWGETVKKKRHDHWIKCVWSTTRNSSLSFPVSQKEVWERKRDLRKKEVRKWVEPVRVENVRKTYEIVISPSVDVRCESKDWCDKWKNCCSCSIRGLRGYVFLPSNFFSKFFFLPYFSGIESQSIPPSLMISIRVWN